MNFNLIQQMIHQKTSFELYSWQGQSQRSVGDPKRSNTSKVFIQDWHLGLPLCCYYHHGGEHIHCNLLVLARGWRRGAKCLNRAISSGLSLY